eukprot:13029558-Alexandrium_andersonii.AAC.1
MTQFQAEQAAELRLMHQVLGMRSRLIPDSSSPLRKKGTPRIKRNTLAQSGLMQIFPTFSTIRNPAIRSSAYAAIRSPCAIRNPKPALRGRKQILVPSHFG